jgi:hypothetical protein
MTHLALTRVWSHLQSRVDTSNILCEVLGEHALSTVGKPLEIVRDKSFTLVVCIKVIFNLQRTFAQSSNPSPASLSHLVPARVLLAAI